MSSALSAGLWIEPAEHGIIDRGEDVGALHVHEFMSLDGVIDAPTWTF